MGKSINVASWTVELVYKLQCTRAWTICAPSIRLNSWSWKSKSGKQDHIVNLFVCCFSFIFTHWNFLSLFVVDAKCTLRTGFTESATKFLSFFIWFRYRGYHDCSSLPIDFSIPNSMLFIWATINHARSWPVFRR